MQTISLKLPATLQNALEREAARRRVSKSELIRDCLAEMLSTKGRSRKGTCYDLTRHLAGSLRGAPRDIATNPRFLDGLGE